MCHLVANLYIKLNLFFQPCRSVSVSSGDSDDDETDTVDGATSQKIRQKKMAQQFPSSLHKSVSTPSIVGMQKFRLRPDQSLVI